MASLTLRVLLINLSLGYDPEFLRASQAIMQVESGGDPQALGDAGRAVGPYQIHRAYWQDAMRILGQDWPYELARNPDQALQAVYAYTRHYARFHHRPWTAETISRIHNGGPWGWKKRATRTYWRKVQIALRACAKGSAKR